MSPKIAILVACHRDDVRIPDNDLLLPIQVGASRSNYLFDGMVHDNEGDNISDKNPTYCELTAIYWAWKNLDADYIGLFHYRRYLSFSSQQFPTNYFGDVYFDTNDDKTLDAIGLEASKMRDVIESYDIILPEKGGFVDGSTIREQYLSSWQHKKSDLDTVENIISERFPEMMPSFEEYMNSKEGYFCNMFIMKKSIFDSYCEWLFGILDEHERRSDFSSYDRVSYRVSGYLAERLLGVYITHLKRTGSEYKIKELQRPFFVDVSKPRALKPAFDSQDSVTLVLSANDYYVPYLSALLESIKDNSSDEHCYDIVVLHSDISPNNQAILKRQIARHNISLRFAHMSSLIKEWEDKLTLRGHFKIETYYRLFIQDLMPDWHKVLYLDSDMIVLKDIAEVFHTDIDGYLLGAVRDADTAGIYNGWEPGKKDYMDKILKIQDPYSYFQAGTILFNLDEFRKSFTVEELFEFASKREWELLDQDVLNYFAQGRVKYLPMNWNVMMDWRGIRIPEIIGRAPHALFDEYMEARKDPAICHFAGPDKPWDDFSEDFAPYFWFYARKTPYYEVILDRALRYRPAHKAKGYRRIAEPIWNFLRPIYEKLYPANTKKREKAGYRYRKLRGRW